MDERPSQEERGRRFAALHEGPCFLIPNPWDGGTAWMLDGDLSGLRGGGRVHEWLEAG